MGNTAQTKEIGRTGGRPLRRLGIAAATIALLSTTSAGIAVPPIAAAIRHAADAVTLLAERSPGLRAAGAISTKGKRAHTPEAAPIPAATALENVVGPKSFDLTAEEAPMPAAAPLPADLFPETLTMLPSASPVGPLFGGGGGSPAGSSVVPFGGSGGGGGGNTGGGGNPPPPPPPPSPVPEPMAWAMMIAGFALIGSTLRGRRQERAGI